MFFSNTPQDRENPVIIVEAPKNIILVADGTDKSNRWSDSIIRYEVWEKDKSRVPFPEYLISLEVPREDILGVLYKGKEYSKTDFIETFGQKITE